MALSDPLRDFGRTDLSKAEYIGTVVNNQDPEKQQRVKMRVAQLHRDVPDEDLPWVRPTNSGLQANAGVGVGSVRVPPKGAKMNFSLPDNDPHNPRISGSPTTDDVNKDNELLNEDYPGTYGDVDQAGNKVAINTEKNTRTETHKSGTTYNIDGEGNVSIYSAKDLTLSANGNIIIASKGSMKVHATGALDLKGSRIDLNAAGAPTTVSSPNPRTRPTIPDPTGKTSL